MATGKAKNLAFVCVPGAFCPAEMFDTTVAAFEKQGYQASAITLPSVGRRPEGPATFEEDVEHIQSKVLQLADQGLDVVLVGNSYGAWAMGEAAKGLSKAERQAESKAGGLIHLVYLASPFATRTGQSLADFLADGGVHIPGIPDDEGFEAPPPAELAGSVLVPSLSKEEQLRYGSMLQPFSSKAHHSKLTYVGYQHIPSTAVITTKDLVVDAKWQHDIFDAASEGKSHLRKLELAGDHCCMTSHPVETAKISIEAALLLA